jgi:hypothetical protein
MEEVEFLENIIRGDISECQRHGQSDLIFLKIDLVLMQQTGPLWYWGIFIVLCLYIYW